jgi:hypothetical protein
VSRPFPSHCCHTPCRGQGSSALAYPLPSPIKLHTRGRRLDFWISIAMSPTFHRRHSNAPFKLQIFMVKLSAVVALLGCCCLHGVASGTPPHAAFVPGASTKSLGNRLAKAPQARREQVRAIALVLLDGSQGNPDCSLQEYIVLSPPLTHFFTSVFIFYPSHLFWMNTDNNAALCKKKSLHAAIALSCSFCGAGWGVLWACFGLRAGQKKHSGHDTGAKRRSCRAH